MSKKLEKQACKAELYDEVWQKATGMGFMNVTMALESVVALRLELDSWRARCARRVEDIQLIAGRLTAAEQRNAELVELLRSTAHTADDLLDQLINATEDFDEPISEEEIEEHRAVIATALKPTESGASEAERKEDDEALQRRFDQERSDYLNELDEE